MARPHGKGRPGKAGYNKVMKKKEKKGVKTKGGTVGEKSNFLTKDVVKRKLQLEEADFMRLCIFKGIHPREPKKKFGDPTALWYHVNDFKALNNDPLIDTFRNMKRFDRKMARYIHRKEHIKAQGHKDRCEPYYNLARVVKERYPTFDAAINDALDDALSTLAIIARLPSDDTTEMNTQFILEAQQLMDHFHYIVSRLGSIDKAFISMKGFYFGAKIEGNSVMWLLPHQASIDTKGAIDFSLISTYAEFYITLLKFVVYRFYTMSGLQYPPVYEEGTNGSHGFLNLSVERYNGEDDGVEGADRTDEDQDDDDKLETEMLEMRKEDIEAAAKAKNTLFSACKVFINQEVPLNPVAMLLVTGGAQVGWYENASDMTKTSPYSVMDPVITHHIIDRPKLPKLTNEMTGRVFVQPQWVFDSFNAGKMLGVEAYNIGKVPPVHMSPFVAPIKTKEQLEKEKGDVNAMEDDEETQLRMTMMSSTNRYMYRTIGMKEEEKAKKKYLDQID